jgi:FkbM family methyltransferase
MLLVMLAHAQAATPAQECPKPTTELKLNSIIAGLFLERNMPAGSIIDVGALDGAFACFYARVAPDRIIHALDPFPSNVESFRRRYAITFPNIHPMVAALGEARSVVSLGRLAKVQANGAFTQLSDIHLAKAQKPTAASPEAATVPIYAADDLFKTKWSGERLGFAHIDVEGSVCGCKSHSEPIAFMLPILTFPFLHAFSGALCLAWHASSDSVRQAHLHCGSPCALQARVYKGPRQVHPSDGLRHVSDRRALWCVVARARVARRGTRARTLLSRLHAQHSPKHLLRSRLVNDRVRVCTRRDANGLPQPPELPSRQAIPFRYARPCLRIQEHGSSGHALDLRACLPLLLGRTRVLSRKFARCEDLGRSLLLLLAPCAAAPPCAAAVRRLGERHTWGRPPHASLDRCSRIMGEATGLAVASFLDSRHEACCVVWGSPGLRF